MPQTDPEAFIIAMAVSFGLGAIIPFIVISILEKKGKSVLFPQVKIFYSSILGVLICLPAGALLWPVGLSIVLRRVIEPKEWRIPLMAGIIGLVLTVSVVAVMVALKR